MSSGNVIPSWYVVCQTGVLHKTDRKLKAVGFLETFIGRPVTLKRKSEGVYVTTDLELPIKIMVHAEAYREGLLT
jgi:hypothetical protein